VTQFSEDRTSRSSVDHISNDTGAIRSYRIVSASGAKLVSAGLSLGLLFLADSASAQAATVPTGFVQADMLAGVQSVTELASGAIELTMVSGEIVVIPAGSAQIVGGVAFVTETAAALEGLGVAGGTVAGGFGGTGLVLAGIAGAGGVVASVASGGEEDAPNIAPVFTSATSNNVVENQTTAYTARATDADNGAALSYSLSGADAALFDINSATGVVTFKAAPDFETPDDAGADNVYDLVVTVTDGTDTVDQAVVITVTDENDNAPVFTSDPTVSIAENQTVVYTAAVMDADAGTTLIYSLSGADAALFDIDSATGVVTFKSVLDFETPSDAGADNVYDIVVTASDGENSTDQAVTISVLDQNDNAPVFTSGAAATVTENQTAAYTAIATDADAGTTLTYTLSGADAALFDVDSATGVVTFKSAPDFENPSDAGGNNIYDIVVSASDGFTTTDQSVAITVMDQNDNAPVFTSGATATVAENQTAAYTAMASDADAGTTLSYALSGVDSALFNIDSATGVVTFKMAPDFEMPGDVGGNNVYDIIVTANDGTNTIDQSVAITVTNENDNAPTFTSGATASVAENQTVAYTAAVTDADGSVITYTLSGADAALFDITANGVVTFKTAPDFETPGDAGGNNVYDIVVTASDSVSTINQAVAITVTDANDNAPIFTSAATATVVENTAASTTVYTANATDTDTVGAVTYALSGADAALFNIDSATGVVTFKASPDFETPGDAGGNNVYDIVVTASDGVNVTGQAVAITVTDQNDNAPVFTSGASATAAENQTTAYAATATDADTGETLNYALSGADAALFDIDSTTGIVTFKAVPDFEAPSDTGADNVYNVVVTASDGVNTTDQAVAITVTDQNDIAPVFTSGAAATVAENAAAATIVYTATATDTDTIGTLTFALSGADAALFNIDSATGVVTFKASPDFETPADAGGNNVYDIVVTVSDGVNTSDQAVSITVTDSNDNAPIFTSGATVSVSENQTAAYSATATDADAGAMLSYALSGVDAALFNIDSVTGVVTFKAAPDFETPRDGGGNNIYDIIVTASDGMNTTDQAVAITVTDVLEQTIIDVSSFSANQGFIIQGDNASDLAGASISNVGDVNGDGYDDILVGAFNAGNGGSSRSGQAYIIFGSNSGFGSEDDIGRQVIDLSTLTSSQGFSVQGGGIAADRFGAVVSSAGDVNGDGFEDFMVSDPTTLAPSVSANGFNAGETYVFFGGATGISTVADFVIQGDSEDDRSGSTLSSLGDINGDGFDDLAITSTGEAGIIFGTRETFGTSFRGRQIIDLTTISESEGFLVVGSNEFGRVQIFSSGDVNGDGFDDMIFQTGGDTGLIYGAVGGFGAADASGRFSIDISELKQDQGVIIQGASSAQFSSIGDVNGDGFSDIMFANSNFGSGGLGSSELKIIFGNSSGYGAVDESGRQVADFSNVTTSQGFIIRGNEGKYFFSSAGDVNGDGYDDIIIGSLGNNNGIGQAYIVFGAAGGFGEIDQTGQSIIDLSLLSSTQGFIIRSNDTGDEFGRVSAAGDVNGDGFDDVIVSAPLGDDGGLYAGEAYVIFGGRTGTEDTTAVTVTGTASVDNFTGNAGNDTFTAIGTNDVVRGGAGNDSITVTGLDYADIRGGTGTDTLTLDGAGLSLNLTTVSSAGLSSIEIIDLTGTGDNSLTLDARGVFQLTEERSGGTATLTVQGNAGDGVTLQGAFVQGLQVVDGGITYTVYTDGNAVVRVQEGVGVSTVGASRNTELSDDESIISLSEFYAETYQDGEWLFSRDRVDVTPVDDGRSDAALSQTYVEAMIAGDMIDVSGGATPLSLFESLSIDLDNSVWNDLGESMGPMGRLLEDLSVEQTDFAVTNPSDVFETLSVETVPAGAPQQGGSMGWVEPALQDIVDDLTLFVDDGLGLDLWVSAESL